MKKKKPIHH